MSAGDRSTRTASSAPRSQDSCVRALTPDEEHPFVVFSSGPDYTFAPFRAAAQGWWLEDAAERRIPQEEQELMRTSGGR